MTLSPGFHGITPACAGKRLRSGGLPHGAGNHPRVRGEEMVWAWTAPTREESPPRARGRVVLHGHFHHLRRITPACAGKSELCPRMPILVAESPPRARGRVRSISASTSITWNHPRVRGEEPERRGVQGRAGGITPACAGKSPPACWAIQAGIESPPRARGRDGFYLSRHQVCGITPACAGKRVMKMRPQRTWLYLLSANFPLFSRASFERRAIPKHGTEGYSIIKRHGISFVMRPGRPRPPVRAGSPRPTLHCP